MCRWLMFFVMLMVMANTACRSVDTRHTKQTEMEIWTWMPEPATTDNVVAFVNDWPITVSQIQALVDQKGISPEEALQLAIDTLLVIQHANDSYGPRFFSDAFKSAAIHAFVREFERKNPPEDIPETELRKIYNEIQKKDFSPPPFSSHKFYFSHEQWRASSQLIVKTNEKHDPEAISGVDSLLRLVRDHYQLQQHQSEETFRNQAWILQNTYIPVAFEQLPPISKNNEENFYRFNGEFDTHYLEELFALPTEGAISDIFGTKFGRHWVYVTRIIPERHLSFEDARTELRQMVAKGWQTQCFEEWIQRLRQEHHAQIDGRARP